MMIAIRSLAVALGLGLLAGCGGQADDSAALHRGNRLEPLTLDPHRAHIMDERTIVSDLFVGLYQPGPDARPVLALAETADVSADGLTWTFTLREANWSDGTPITADDVVYGLQRTVDPETRNQFPSPVFMIENAAEIAAGEAPVASLGAAAPDGSTVVLTLEYPAPYLPSALMYWGQPAPRHAIEAHGEDWIQPDNIVVSGPFILEEWRSNFFIRLAANPQFYDAEDICLEEVFFYPTTETASAERRVRNGELDLNPEFLGANLARLRRDHPEMTRMAPSFTWRNVTLNTAAEPFDDVRVRRALSLAVDRDFIADDVLGGADTAAWRVIPEGLAGRREGVGLDFRDQLLEARREEARALLQAAGYGPDNPLRFTFHHTPTAGWPRVAPVLQQHWSLIADWVSAEILVRDSQLHYDAMRAGDFQAGASGWVPDFDDPFAYLMQWETAAGEINYSRWTDPAYDALIAEAQMTADTEARADLLAQAEQLFLDGGAAIPVFIENSRNLVGPRVTGWEVNPVPINPSRWLCVDGVEDE